MRLERGRNARFGLKKLGVLVGDCPADFLLPSLRNVA